MDWSRISPHLVWLLVACLLSFSVFSSLHASRAGEPSRPPPASAGHCCPAGAGARASPAADMGHAPSPRRPRGVHRPRLLRCWVQETACFSTSPPTRAVPSPFLPPPVVSEARAAAPSRPGSLTTSHRPREWWRQWQPPALTLRALSPFPPGSPAPGRTLGSSGAPLSPSGCHSYTLQTLLSLWLPFIISGLGWPRTLGRQPRGWGRRDLGLALLSLA